MDDRHNYAKKIQNKKNRDGSRMPDLNNTQNIYFLKAEKKFAN
jgi:hypothetical protein